MGVEAERIVGWLQDRNPLKKKMQIILLDLISLGSRRESRVINIVRIRILLHCSGNVTVPLQLQYELTGLKKFDRNQFHGYFNSLSRHFSFIPDYPSLIIIIPRLVMQTSVRNYTPSH